MKEPEEKEDDLGFGSWQRQSGVPRSIATDIIDKVLGDEDHIEGGMAPQDIVAQGKRYAGVKSLAVNQATMMCERGPCRWRWSMLCRSSAQIRGADRVNVTRVVTCDASPADPTDLADSNVFACARWQPAAMSFIPAGLWSMLREPVTKIWEYVLKKQGYSFDFRWWKGDPFLADAPDKRGAPMAGPADQGLYFDKQK